MDEKSRIDFHRLFAAFWRDLLTDEPMKVENEIDLSKQQQFLDVALLRRGTEPLSIRLPDGFEELAAHNLISFKSYQETLDASALEELVGHYVDYRKYVSPKLDNLTALTDFRLFAISVRYPRDLAQELPLREVRPGVYAIPSFTQQIRIIVVHQLPQVEQNALLHLFSFTRAGLEFGRLHYQVRNSEGSTLLAKLLGFYRLGGIEMPFDLDRYVKKLRDDFIGKVSAEELRESVPTETLLKAIPEEKRLEGIPTEKRLEGLSAKDRLIGLSKEEREDIFRTLQSEKEANPS